MQPLSAEAPHPARLQNGARLLFFVGFCLCLGGLGALAVLAVRAPNGEVESAVRLTSMTIFALAILPTGLVQAVLVLPATRNVAPGRAIAGAVIGSLGAIVAFPLSLAQFVVAPLLLAIGLNVLGVCLLVAGWSERASWAADRVARGAASAILTAVGVFATGGAVVLTVSAAQRSSGSTVAILIVVTLFSFGLVESFLGRLTAKSASTAVPVAGGLIALLGGGAAWASSPRPGPEALIALLAGIAVLVLVVVDRSTSNYTSKPA